jgi:hypothetical protein
LGIIILCLFEIFLLSQVTSNTKQESHRFLSQFKVCRFSNQKNSRFNFTTIEMLARFQVLFALLALFTSGKSFVINSLHANLSNNSSAFAYSNTTFITTPSVIVTAPISTGTGSGVSTVNSTLLVTPTPTSSSSPTVSANAAGSNAGYLNAAVAGVVALGAAFVSL